MICIAIGVPLAFLGVLALAMYLSAMGPVVAPFTAYSNLLLSPVGFCLAATALSGLVAFACTVARDSGGIPFHSRRRGNGVILPALALSPYPSFFLAMCFMAFLWASVALLFLLWQRRTGSGTNHLSRPRYAAMALWLALWLLLLVVAAALWTSDVVVASAMYSPVSVLGTNNLYAGLFFGWLAVALLLFVVIVLALLAQNQATAMADEHRLSADASQAATAAATYPSHQGQISKQGSLSSQMVMNPMFQAEEAVDFVIDDDGFGEAALDDFPEPTYQQEPGAYTPTSAYDTTGTAPVYETVGSAYDKLGGTTGVGYASHLSHVGTSDYGILPGAATTVGTVDYSNEVSEVATPAYAALMPNESTSDAAGDAYFIGGAVLPRTLSSVAQPLEKTIPGSMCVI